MLGPVLSRLLALIGLRRRGPPSWLRAALTVLGFALLTLAPTSSALADEPLHPEDRAAEEARNKAVARRVFDEIFNQGRFEVADEIYARDFQNHGLHRTFGLEEDQAAVHAEKHAFPDLQMTVERMVAEGDLVTVVWTLRGTHTAFGYGLPPTGAKIEMRGMTVWRVVDGKLRDEWTSFDQLGPYLQVMEHVKWRLLALFGAVVSLGWGASRGVRRLRRRAQSAPGASPPEAGA
jgi:steroid delta-isomerase-like uncharacterized protein